MLRWVTHGAGGDVFDSSTTMPWAALCEAVACLRVDLRQVVQLVARAVAGTGPAGHQ